MQQISEGNINIKPAITDDKDEIGPALQQMMETIKNLSQGNEYLTKSAMEGKLDVRGNEGAFNGAYQDIVQGVNETLDAVMGPINEASGLREDSQQGHDSPDQGGLQGRPCQDQRVS